MDGLEVSKVFSAPYWASTAAEARSLAAPLPQVWLVGTVPSWVRDLIPYRKAKDMMGKLTLLAGAAIGYVLGAKAGRQRYDQIMGRASETWSSEPVQSKLETAKETVKARAPKVADKVGEAAKVAGSKVKSMKNAEDSSETAGSDIYADAGGFGSSRDEIP